MLHGGCLYVAAACPGHSQPQSAAYILQAKPVHAPVVKLLPLCCLLRACGCKIAIDAVQRGSTASGYQPARPVLGFH
jgi:hypothetical protein